MNTITTYYFCDDIWREIKSYMFRKRNHKRCKDCKTDNATKCWGDLYVYDDINKLYCNVLITNVCICCWTKRIYSLLPKETFEDNTELLEKIEGKRRKDMINKFYNDEMLYIEQQQVFSNLPLKVLDR